MKGSELHDGYFEVTINRNSQVYSTRKLIIKRRFVMTRLIISCSDIRPSDFVQISFGVYKGKKEEADYITKLTNIRYITQKNPI